jgi:hypothetical protein
MKESTMTPSKLTEKRPYQQSGLYAVHNALKTIGDQDNWIESLGEVGVELKAWKTLHSSPIWAGKTISAPWSAVL